MLVLHCMANPFLQASAGHNGDLQIGDPPPWHSRGIKLASQLPSDLISFLYYLHTRIGCESGILRVTAFCRIASLQSFHLRS